MVLIAELSNEAQYINGFCSSLPHTLQGMWTKLCQIVLGKTVFNTASREAGTRLLVLQKSARLTFASSQLCGVVKRHLNTTAMEGNIIHDKDKKVFFVQLTNNGGKAVLEYEVIDSKTLDFYHTGVPVSHRGMGIAKHLVKAGFDYAIAERLQVRPTCTYVLKYVNEHLDEVGFKENVILS